MSISSITETQINFTQPTSSSGSTGSDDWFQLASANASAGTTSSGTTASGSTDPWQTLAADLQSSLLSLQSQGSAAAGAATGTNSGTQTDATSTGQTVGQAHHHHHHHHGAGTQQADQQSLTDPSQTATAAATPVSLTV